MQNLMLMFFDDNMHMISKHQISVCVSFSKGNKVDFFQSFWTAVCIFGLLHPT